MKPCSDRTGYTTGMLCGLLPGLLVLAMAFPALADEDEDNNARPPAQTPMEMQPSLFGDSPREVDTERWQCRMCPYEFGWEGELLIGAGHISDASFMFGRYTGLEDDGLFPLLDGELRYRDENGRFWTIRADDAGLRSRSLQAETGRQGHYGAYFSYDQLPRFIANGTRTVFSGTGTGELRLPDDWTPTGSTRTMPDLETSLRPVAIHSERNILGTGLAVQRSSRWEYQLDFQSERREGTRMQGASFLTNAAILPMPVDYRTNQVDASAAYTRRDWQLRFAYHGSFFNNDTDTVTWDNPFAPITAGADEGRMALYPDNRFNQLMVSGNWNALNQLTGSGHVAIGRAEQTTQFTDTTINPMLDPGPLPQDNLNGRVDTLSAKLRLNSTPLRHLRLQGNLHHDERDNRTPRELWPQVSNDVALTDPRYNRPYSFERSGGSLDADYRPINRLTLSSGLSREEHERTYQETRATATSAYWAGMRLDAVETVDLRLRFREENRSFIKPYEAQNDIDPEENPLLRKFSMAERRRELIQLHLNWMPADTFGFAFGIDRARDDYNKSRIGLRKADDLSYTLDASWTPAFETTVYGFIARQEIESKMAGSEAFGEPDWFGSQQDRINSAGVGLDMKEIIGRLSGGFDYTYTRAIGEIDVRTRDPHSPLPDLRNRLHSVQLHLDYPVNDRLGIRGQYWYEQFRSEDFFHDGVEPDTLRNILVLGQESPNYRVHVIGLALRYRFGPDHGSSSAE